MFLDVFCVQSFEVNVHFVDIGGIVENRLFINYIANETNKTQANRRGHGGYEVLCISKILALRKSIALRPKKVKW